MTKILSVILIIIVIGGGVYFYKNNMDQDVTSGDPIATSALVVDKSNGGANFYPTHYGPTVVVPIIYNLDISKESKNYTPKQIPKVKIICPAGVSAFIPNGYSTIQVDACGKQFSMTKNDSIKSILKYELNLNFINTSKENKKVASEVTVDGKVSKGIDWTIPPAYSEQGLGLMR